MSYRRKFSKDFDIPLTVSISDPSYHTDGEGKVSGTSRGHVHVDYNGHTYSFPIGLSGGSDYHDLTHAETVDVNIEVDTEPFDDSVSNCNDQVMLLTNTVAVTEAAQVESIQENSKKVAKTIITGFFKNVQADISSRIMELSQKVDSRLMHLREQSKTLLSKRSQMENDYQRTKARYNKIIEDLNKELENRVKALDAPVFKMVSMVETESDRMINADFAEIASVIAKENTALSAQIGAAMTKKRAKQAISQAVDFLKIQKLTDLAINRTTISGLKAENAAFYLPVCYFEAKESKGVTVHDCEYDKEHLPQDVVNKVDDQVFCNPDMAVKMLPVEQENIETYFKASIQEAYQASSTPHDERVVNTISKLFFE